MSDDRAPVRAHLRAALAHLAEHERRRAELHDAAGRYLRGLVAEHQQPPPPPSPEAPE